MECVTVGKIGTTWAPCPGDHGWAKSQHESMLAVLAVLPNLEAAKKSCWLCFHLGSQPAAAEFGSQQARKQI